MLSDKEFNKISDKMQQMEITYTDLIFTKAASLDCTLYETKEHLFSNIPEGGIPIEEGTLWGGEKVNGWFKTSYTVTKETAGKKLFLSADTGALETLVFINGKPHGVLASKIVIGVRGNHHALIISDGAEEGTSFDIALEAYCWHNEVGTQPFKKEPNGPYDADHPVKYNGVYIQTRDDEIMDFSFQLKAVNEIAAFTRDSYKKAEAQNTLYEVYHIVSQVPSDRGGVDKADLKKAVSLLKKITGCKNANPDYPTLYVTGHSHLDTAWLWTISETIRKAARTYSNAITMMKEYPEYIFLQSSACHADMMKQHYPSIFEDMQEMAAKGRWEPNGAVWIECDCNITGNEAMVRQFLYGQKFTMKEFGFKSDTFWLPDTFGYSASLPQIMKLSQVKYFCTTKMSWNDTNYFPYDTFYWQGIDGSQVLANLIDIQMGPTPKWAYTALYEKKRGYRISNLRFNSFGYGDGGAGPSYDLLEMARISENIEGVPQVKYSSISSYMDKLDKTNVDAPIYRGELYLELHRGTLTSQSEIKRGNRKSEEALHALDAINTTIFSQRRKALDYEALWKKLLIKQFHDILPGTCLTDVNRSVVTEFRTLLSDIEDEIHKLLKEDGKANIYNPSPFRMDDVIIKRALEGFETIPSLMGESTYIEKASIPAYSSIPLSSIKKNEKGNIKVDGNHVETDYLKLSFDERGVIISLYDKIARREVAGRQGLDRLFMNEDVPQAWDNWDVDKDLIENLKAFDGSVSFTLLKQTDNTVTFESKTKLAERSSMRKLIRIYSNKKQIDFEVSLDWHEKHTLLKTGFDFDINARGLRSEIQFGHIIRPIWKTNSYEEAKFEVSNHRWSDYSEPHYGAAILNDSKYGINGLGSMVSLSLIKSGTHPDPDADEGLHTFSYSLLLHDGFSTASVIKPAYNFNAEPRLYEGRSIQAPIAVDKENVIVETLKVSEDKKAVIVRMYEAEGDDVWCALHTGFSYQKAEFADFLEEKLEAADITALHFRPFEIKTLKLYL